MRKILIFLSLSLLTTQGFSARITGTIEEIDQGNPGQDQLIKLDDGRVIFAKSRDNFFTAKQLPPEGKVEIEIDRFNNLKSISSLPNEDMPDEDLPEMKAFENKSSDISEAEAQRIFSGMNRSYKSKTECTDRAQVWAYEEFKKNNLYSRKIFLFFTNTYIRKYRFYWWFHVSPYVNTTAGVERVLDRRYTSGPRNVKTWTDIFMRSNRTCPEKTYKHYRSNKNGPEHCFVVKTDMYYRLPYNVRMLEDYGRVKSSFSQSEVNFSYRAFRTRGVRN